MKFVALLSGGKDSCYNIEKCIQYGHRLECVANLHPPLDAGVDEVNSYMYQSAAYNAIPQLAQCLGVPLIRRALAGTAVLQTLDYEKTPDDEVEDLYELLLEVKTRFPDVEGVSCGTIVSSYQRFRVENVCERLGLVPLTYLWQRDRAELLREMIDAGVNAVLVKVAGAGLDPDKHLGKSLAVLEPTLHRLHNKFELDVCGEGGEYESLVLDCSCFQKALEITGSEVVYDDEDPSVGSLKILTCEVRDKPDVTSTVNEILNPNVAEEANVQHVEDMQPRCPTMATHHLVFDNEGFCQTPLLIPNSATTTDASLQLQSLFQSLAHSLRRHDVDLKDVVFVHLYLSDMSLFSLVNAEYCEWFGVDPPSRSCVAVPLPPGIYVTMDALVLAGSYADMKVRRSGQLARREVLHVRSLSEWAPVSIGPYAQANVLNKALLLIAGQIGLHPPTMQMISSAVKQHQHFLGISADGYRYESLSHLVQLELYQSLLNVDRVIDSLDVQGGGISSAVMCVVYTTLSNDSPIPTEELSGEANCLYRELVKCARNQMHAVCARRQQQQGGDEGSVESEDSGTGEETLSKNIDNFPVLVIGVSELPRRALVEVEVIAVTAMMRTCGITYFSAPSCATMATKPMSSIVAAPASSPLEDMRSLPLWTTSYKPYPPPPNSLSVQLEIPSRVVTRVHLSKCDTVLCEGFISVLSSRGETGRNTESVYLDIREITETFCDELNHVMRMSIMTKADLRSLKIFYNAKDFCVSDLMAVFSSSLLRKCGVDLLPHLIPTSNGSRPDAVFDVQFSFVNFIQMKTELWIRNR